MNLSLRLPSERPDPSRDIETFMGFIAQGEPFSFLRFSDGESEIIHNRQLEIREGTTLFRGRTFENSFPKWDSKSFSPARDTEVRADLIQAASKNLRGLFKGVLTSSNRRLSERHFMERLNSFDSSSLTFTDLLINENFTTWRTQMLPLIRKTGNRLFVVANFRAKPDGILSGATHIAVPDNLFDGWAAHRDQTLEALLNAPPKSIVLSSASSLSNVLGLRLRSIRPDITFLDVGTSINEFLGLGQAARAYFKLSSGSGLAVHLSRFFSDYRMKW